MSGQQKDIEQEKEATQTSSKKPAGLTSSSEYIETMRDAFDLFITNDIKEIILK